MTDGMFTELEKRGTKLVLEQVVTTIMEIDSYHPFASVASEKNFNDFFFSYSSSLRRIVDLAKTPESWLLRRKTFHLPL